MSTPPGVLVRFDGVIDTPLVNLDISIPSPSNAVAQRFQGNETTVSGPASATAAQPGPLKRRLNATERLKSRSMMEHTTTRAEIAQAQLKHRKDIERAISSMETWALANEHEASLVRDTVDLAKGLFLATIAPQYDEEIDGDLEDPELLAACVADGPTNAERALAARGATLQVPSATDAPLTPRAAAIAEVMQQDRAESILDAEVSRETSHAVMRAAVCCLLLERMCGIFSRYHSVLSILSEMVVRSIFVPDTAEMRQLLGGTVAFPLRGVPLAYRSLLAPYARKTYFVAHDEVAAQVLALAKSNRAVEMRLSRQSKIFDTTVKHWVASIVRNLFLSWRSFTRKRKAMKIKFHGKFARLRVDTLKSHCIRNWRERATALRRACALEAGAAELAHLTQSTENLQEMIQSLTDQNNNLTLRMMAQEKERQDLNHVIAQKEKQFFELQTRTVEMDRVGTELLESMLLSEPLPKGNTPLEVMIAWAHQMIDDAGGFVDPQISEPLHPLLSEDFIVSVPLSALAAVMIQFNSPHAPTREEVVALHSATKRAPQLLVDMYERLVEGPSLVSTDQIASMHRGVLLLFLAGLFRHVSNWVVCKPPVTPNHRKQGVLRERELLRRKSAQLGVPGGGGARSDGGGLLGALESGGATTQRAVPPQELAPQHQHWMDLVKNQQQWIACSMAALHLALEASTQRPVSLTSEEQEDMVTFLDISIASVFDLLPKQRPDVAFIQLLKGLQQLFPEMRKVYMAYAVPVMHFMDFLRLCKDCRLLGPAKLSKKDVESMCRGVYVRQALAALERARGASVTDQHHSATGGGAASSSSKATRWSSSHRGAGRSTGADDEDNGVEGPIDKDTLMSDAQDLDVSVKVLEPRGFIECLVRTALMHHRKSSREAKSAELSVSIVSVFVLETVVPHALRLDVDKFRQTARHPLVRQVLSRHKMALRKAFRKYATVSDGEAISKLQFFQMAKDGRWFNKLVTTDVVGEVFRRCQGGPDAEGGVEGLDLNEWHEALCALAVYTDPNPLVPLYVKLPTFLEEKVLVALQV